MFILELLFLFLNLFKISLITSSITLKRTTNHTRGVIRISFGSNASTFKHVDAKKYNHQDLFWQLVCYRTKNCQLFVAKLHNFLHSHTPYPYISQWYFNWIEFDPIKIRIIRHCSCIIPVHLLLHILRGVKSIIYGKPKDRCFGMFKQTSLRDGTYPGYWYVVCRWS